MATEEEFINIAWACRGGAWKSKAQLEVGIAMDIKGNKKSLSCFVSGKRLNRENVDPSLNGAGDLVTLACTECHLCLSLHQQGLSSLWLPGAGVPLDVALLLTGKVRTCASPEFGSTDFSLRELLRSLAIPYIFMMFYILQISHIQNQRMTEFFYTQQTAELAKTSA